MQNTISSRSLQESPDWWKRRASQRGIMNQAPVANSEFFQNMVDVVLYRVLGKAQEFGDLLVAQLTQQQFQHFLLPDGEHLSGAACRARPLRKAAEVRKQRVGDGRRAGKFPVLHR